jgi:hypothetical protein
MDAAFVELVKVGLLNDGLVVLPAEFGVVVAVRTGVVTAATLVGFGRLELTVLVVVGSTTLFVAGFVPVPLTVVGSGETVRVPPEPPIWHTLSAAMQLFPQGMPLVQFFGPAASDGVATMSVSKTKNTKLGVKILTTCIVVTSDNQSTSIDTQMHL